MGPKSLFLFFDSDDLQGIVSLLLALALVDSFLLDRADSPKSIAPQSNGT